MNASRKTVCFAALASLYCTHVAAQDMFKCKDANGRITYTSKECRQVGLSPVGVVKGSVNVAPAPAAPVSSQAAAKEAVTTAAREAQKKKEVDVGCYTTVNARGVEISRCKDGD